jgi:hypothetical protein
MKKLFYFSIMVLFLAACGGNRSDTTNTHTHEDGTEHSQDHENEAAPSTQESFDVEGSDTIFHDDHDHDHNHDHDHDHDHPHTH